ncbi:MAG: hypothetical protein LBP29_02325 [Treponema sp.]|nr:hypothetical protein [Treponema sp.]
MRKAAFGLIGLLVLGFVFSGCATTGANSGSNAPTIEGTWKHPNPESKNATIVFTGNTFEYTWDSGSGYKGTFTIEGKKIQFITTTGETWDTTYTLTKNTLTLAQGTIAQKPDSLYWYGAFKRQS